MEGLAILLVLTIVVAPITLSIIAIVKVSNLRVEINQLRRQLAVRKTEESSASPKPKPAAPVVAASAPEPQTPRAVVPPVRPVPVKTPPVPPPAKPVPVRSVAPAKPTAGLEFMMGGNAAAFAGIAILVMGIVFLVGYAIQQEWLGPGARIVLGLLSGGILVGVGHFVGRTHEKYTVFARVLTGGGSALFYFSVFAAYGIYHLISAAAAGGGLLASALAVFGLSMVYRSQSVAVLGVLGAFITPLLIGGDIESGIFPLVYVALINVPVILLGIRRKWQVLYNLAFVFTVIHYCVWLEWVSSSELGVGLGFSILFFVEYAVLGLLKLRSEQQVTGRTVDIIRLITASLLLLGAVYYLFDDAGLNQWLGTAFLSLALLHVALAWLAFKTLTRFNGEILSFLAGGLVFAALALPAQLDGEWVSLGWAVEGVVLAWFATRVRSRVLQAGALLLGLIGISKALLFDVSFYTHTPGLFWNARFAVGAVSAILLGVQGKIAGRFPDEETSGNWQDALWWMAVLGAVLVFFSDTFWTLGTAGASSWLITSLMLLVTGVAVILFAPPKSSVTLLGSMLLFLVPIKLLFIDSGNGLSCGGYGLPAFSNAVIWIQLVVIGLVILLIQPRIMKRDMRFFMDKATYGKMLNIMSLLAGIGVISIEMFRIQSDWAATAVTIFWAVSALLLILIGMKRRNPAHRYFGLILFGLASLKVVVVDSSELKGLERIAAFMGTGILLLVLSFAYQKASAYFHSLGEEK